MAKPSEQIILDLEQGNITPAVDFWCYRKAVFLATLPKYHRFRYVKDLHPKVREKIKKYLISILTV